jgi:hypothetical protein
VCQRESYCSGERRAIRGNPRLPLSLLGRADVIK